MGRCRGAGPVNSKAEPKDLPKSTQIDPSRIAQRTGRSGNHIVVPQTEDALSNISNHLAGQIAAAPTRPLKSQAKSEAITKFRHWLQANPTIDPTPWTESEISQRLQRRLARIQQGGGAPLPTGTPMSLAQYLQL